MKPILFAVLFLFSTNLEQNLYVTDGDTIRLNGKRIRLTCIDAPETTQPYGLEAKEHLMKLLKGKDIEVVEESTDRYGRTLAWLIVGGDTINYKMVDDGYAWWYEYYCPDNSTLKKYHNSAKKRKAGLWSQPNPINPYQWRKDQRG
jgi:micrococcal nuclease